MDIRNYQGFVAILLSPDEADLCTLQNSIAIGGESPTGSSLNIPVTNPSYVGQAMIANTIAARRSLLDALIESGEAIVTGKVN